jgi:hypothetical protein
MVQNAAIEVLGRRSRRYTRVRYEDFVADPQSALDRIALMCQAAGADVPSEPEVEPVVHSVAGNPVRFDRGPLQLTADVSWSEQMPTWQRRAVTAISAPMLLRYGYRLTVPAGHARR